jgi:hypothetical protein
MNDEFTRIWKEAGFEVKSKHLPRRAVENYEKA